MKKEKNITGFFSVTKEEVPLFTRERQVDTTVTGRMGIHRSQQKLLEAVRKIPNSIGIGIVEIRVPVDAIVEAKNGVFGIKKGNRIPIVDIAPASSMYHLISS